MVPDKLKTKGLKAYYGLTKDLNWMYLRYVDIEGFEKRPFHLFIYHANGCDNSKNAEWPRAIANSKERLLCSGCGCDIPEDVQKQAQAVWMMERTNYGG